MNYIITSRTAAGKCDEATPALLISNCPRCSEPAWPAAASPPGYEHPSPLLAWGKNSMWLGVQIFPPPVLGPVLGKTPGSRPEACRHWKSFPLSAHEEDLPHFQEQNQSLSMFSSRRSWSHEEIELILDFPRAFLRFSAFYSSLHHNLADKTRPQFSLPWG